MDYLEVIQKYRVQPRVWGAIRVEQDDCIRLDKGANVEDVDLSGGSENMIFQRGGIDVAEPGWRPSLPEWWGPGWVYESRSFANPGARRGGNA